MKCAGRLKRWVESNFYDLTPTDTGDVADGMVARAGEFATEGRS